MSCSSLPSIVLLSASAPVLPSRSLVNCLNLPLSFLFTLLLPQQELAEHVLVLLGQVLAVALLGVELFAQLLEHAQQLCVLAGELLLDRLHHALPHVLHAAHDALGVRLVQQLVQRLVLAVLALPPAVRLADVGLFVAVEVPVQVRHQLLVVAVLGVVVQLLNINVQIFGISKVILTLR